MELAWSKRVINRDEEYFDILFREYYKSLCQFVYRYVKDTQAAESIVQDVFYKLWLNKEKYNISISIKSYLYKFAKNQALNHLRTEKGKQLNIYTPNVEQIALSETPDKLIDQKEAASAINAAVEKLPEKCRQIFIMNRHDGLRYKEIAEILDISVNTVETQMSRAYKSLRKSLAFLISILSF